MSKPKGKQQAKTDTYGTVWQGTYPLATLQGWPGNPKAHDVPGIAASLRRFGFVSPVVLDADSLRIVAGHGRVEALGALRKESPVPPPGVVADDSGDWHVPTVKARFRSEKEAAAYVLADNRLTEAGGWDPELLAKHLKGVDDLAGTGFSQADVDALLRGADDPPKPPDPPGGGGGGGNTACPACGRDY